MRRLSTLLCLLLPAVALAQEGTVRYEMTVQIDVQLPPEMAHMRDQIPSSRTVQKLLLFNESASLMKDAPREETDDGFDSGRRRMRFGRSADDQTYTDLDAGTVVEKKDFLGRTFLVDGETPTLAWRLSEQQAEFLGYPCQRATAMRDTVEVEAWFTTQIPVSAGPETYGGLPGLILVLTEDGGRRTYIAREISLEPLAAGALTPPTEGRRVTQSQYDEIVEQKLREMEAEGGGRRGFIIRSRN